MSDYWNMLNEISLAIVSNDKCFLKDDAVMHISRAIDMIGVFDDDIYKVLKDAKDICRGYTSTWSNTSKCRDNRIKSKLLEAKSIVIERGNLKTNYSSCHGKRSHEYEDVMSYLGKRVYAR